MTDYTFLSVSGTRRSVHLWDIRQPNKHIKSFQKMHHDSLLAIGKLDEETFVTGSEDGMMNIWSIRMSKLMLSISVGSKVSCLRFI